MCCISTVNTNEAGYFSEKNRKQGMAPHKSVQGTLINTKTGLFQIAFKITICVISLVVYFRDFYLEAQFGTFGNITLVRFVVTFRNTAITTLMVIILLSCLSSAKKIHLELTKIEQIDTDLAKMGQEITLSNRNCENRKSAIVLTWVIVLFAVIQAIYPYAFHIQTNYKQIFNVILNFYPRLVVGVRNIFFCLLLMVIKTRFNIINTILKNEIHLSKKNSKSNCNFYKKIKTLVDVHKTMVVVTEEVNSIFSLELLLWISITFVLLLVDVYSITHIVWFNLEENYALIVKLLHNCVMYVFDLFLISITSARVCREANYTKSLVVGIKIGVDNEDDRDLVIASALKLLQNPLEITAFQLFTIDNSLLFSICGVACSYLFIMLQMDINEEEKKQSEMISVTTVQQE